MSINQVDNNNNNENNENNTPPTIMGVIIILKNLITINVYIYNYKIIIEIPHDYKGLVIGTGGATIRRLCDEHYLYQFLVHQK